MRSCGVRTMLNEDNKWYAFDDYTDDHLDARIAFWEAGPFPPDDWCGVLGSLYAERDRRVDEKLLAWVESK